MLYYRIFLRIIIVYIKHEFSRDSNKGLLVLAK